MKTLFLAAAAGMLLLGGAVHANAASPDASVQAQGATGAISGLPIPSSNPLGLDNPTGLRSYEMRPDGLMINGLLPAPGWQG